MRERRMGRGKAQKTMDLIAAAREILVVSKPTTVRSVCYQLFNRGLIPSMKKNETNRVGIQLRWAREQGIIPWGWIVDETRDAEVDQMWQDPDAYIETARRSYRKDRWAGQPQRIEVWSEKGTIQGILSPVLHDYGLTFRCMHGFGSTTAVQKAAQESANAPRPWRVFYVGDWDPSGLYMSEVDLPDRLGDYGGNIDLVRIALLSVDLDDLPSFDADTKRGDTRHAWYVRRYGDRCWELDAMDPNGLRDRVEHMVLANIEMESWKRYALGEEAERQSLTEFLSRWPGAISGQASKCGAPT
jgi:hypothetical protein